MPKEKYSKPIGFADLILQGPMQSNRTQQLHDFHERQRTWPLFSWIIMSIQTLRCLGHDNAIRAAAIRRKVLTSTISLKHLGQLEYCTRNRIFRFSIQSQHTKMEARHQVISSYQINAKKLINRHNEINEIKSENHEIRLNKEWIRVLN